MNKNEFIAYLENRLSVLNKEERDDIINEYIQHIDNKLEEGLSEKEAVETLGNIEDMVREILSAYNVDPNYDTREESKINTVVVGAFRKFVSAIKLTGDYILGQKAINLLKLAVKTVILFFVLWTVFIIGDSLSMFFADMLSSIIGFYSPIRFLVKTAYVVVALPTVVYIFVRFLAFSIKGRAMDKAGNEGSEKAEKAVNNVPNISTPMLKVKKIKPFNGSSDFSFENIISSILSLCIKVLIIMWKAFVIMCLIPCVIGLVFTVIAFGALIVMAIMGYPCIGASIGCLGVDLIGISLVALIVKLVFFNKKEVNLNEEVL